MFNLPTSVEYGLLLVPKFFCIGMNFEITLSLQDMFYLHELVYLVQLPSLLWTVLVCLQYDTN
jgi:hypothetical protein